MRQAGMILDGARRHDDPGLPGRLLAASNAIDRPVPRPAPHKVRLLLAEALVFCLWTAALIGALWILP